MGANAQTTVPSFQVSQVLTSDQMNQSARTGVPVFADTTARDAAFGGSGEKTLAEGQLCYLESTNVVQYYDGAAWATVGPTSAGGLVFISSTTITNGVTTVAVSNVFSSTYDNYRIIISGGGGTDANLTMVLGSTTSGYYWSFSRINYSDASTLFANGNNGTSFARAGYANTNGLTGIIDVQNPNLAKNTTFSTAVPQLVTGAGAGFATGFLNDTTVYTGFTIGGTTFTGGTIKVYGYANS
jgi:hypothetical protein